MLFDNNAVVCQCFIGSKTKDSWQQSQNWGEMDANKDDPTIIHQPRIRRFAQSSICTYVCTHVNHISYIKSKFAFICMKFNIYGLYVPYIDDICVWTK